MNEKIEILTEEETRSGCRQLIFTEEREGNRCKLSVEGELRHGEAHELYNEVTRLFESGVRDVVIDMREVVYTDTVGLQNLVKIYKYVKDHEGLDFSVIAPEGELWETLISCRFDKFMRILRDEDKV